MNPNFIIGDDMIVELCAWRKVVLAAFWDEQATVHLELLDYRAVVNADHYYTKLQHLKEAIQIKCHGLLTEKVILLYYNACLHKDSVTTLLLWSILSGNVLPIHHMSKTLHLSGPMKKHL
jgi:hypothetical protein